MENANSPDIPSIPYIDFLNLQGRFVSSLSFFDAGVWRMWLLAGDRYIETQAWPAEAFYYAAIPEKPTDICFHFLDFVAQRACFSGLQKPILGLRDDVFNLSASLAKIAHLHATRDVVGAGISRMVVTEVEYLFSLCRSMFDLLQEIISFIWDSILLHDTSVKKKPLKPSFSKMVLFRDKESTADQLSERFGLPLPLAEYYVRNSEFFLALRGFRDNLFHKGSQVQAIFSGESGFLIQGSLVPFKTLDIWRDDEKQENDLVPLSPALGYVVYKTLAACEDFSLTLEKIIQFPPPIVPGMYFFMRGYFNDLFSAVLGDTENRINGQSKI